MSGNAARTHDPAATSGREGTGRVGITINASGFRMRCTLEIPAAPVPEHAVVPLLGRLADAITEAVRDGREVTCRAGCGTCCQQLVPVGVPELLHLAAVLAEHPQSDRILERYGDLHDRLRTAALFESVRDIAGLSGEAVARLARDYFRIGVSCPFLEDGQCLIYSERPLSCREYLVTSPAVECSRPELGNVSRVRMPMSLPARVAANASQPGRHSMAFLPASATIRDVERRPAADWLRRLLRSSQVGA